MLVFLPRQNYSLVGCFLPKKCKKNTLKQSDFLILVKKRDFNEENSLIQGTMRQFIDRTEFLFRLQKKSRLQGSGSTPQSSTYHKIAFTMASNLVPERRSVIANFICEAI